MSYAADAEANADLAKQIAYSAADDLRRAGDAPGLAQAATALAIAALAEAVLHLADQVAASAD